MGGNEAVPHWLDLISQKLYCTKRLDDICDRIFGRDCCYVVSVPCRYISHFKKAIMSFDSQPTRRSHRPQFEGPRPRPTNTPPAVRKNPGNTSPIQKRDSWVAKALEAEHSGDRVQGELCRQYADHWHRVALAQAGQGTQD